MQPAELFLRELAPDDLAGFGCYCVNWAELESTGYPLNRADVMAYTSPHLARALQPWLESQGRWAGDGFATIVFRSRIASWHETLGVCCHELAHWLAWDHVEPSDADTSLGFVAEYAASEYKPAVPPWLGHDATFCRVAAHLALRAGHLLEAVKPASVRFSKAYTDVSEATMLGLIADELPYRGSLKALLSTPAPKPFSELWESITDA